MSNAAIAHVASSTSSLSQAQFRRSSLSTSIPTSRHVIGLRPAVLARAGDNLDDLDKQLMEDMARLQEREKPFVSGGSSSSNASMPPSSSSAATDPASPLEGIKEAVDKILIADFFFILFALAWLAAGLAAKSALNFTALLETWLSLWQWVFQPAIGVLMLGALASGGVGWVRENLGGSKNGAGRP